MNKGTKAALLSALVYPGVGHYYLKKYSACFMLVCAFTLPLMLIINDAINKMNHIAELIVSGVIPLEIASIAEAVSDVMATTGSHQSNIQLYVIIFVWCVAVIDAYRIGNKK
jgi:hypothetical protein